MAAERRGLMLKAITLKTFKSYREARLPLAPLTVLIGANASGKSNALEGLRLLSWLAQGRKLSAVMQEARREENSLRGRVESLALDGYGEFTLGCETDRKDWNQLEVRIGFRPDGMHVNAETMTHGGAVVPLYSIQGPAADRSSDVQVAYNNFAKGGTKPHVTCSDQMAIFTQLTSPAAFDARHKDSQREIPAAARAHVQLLGSMLFLDPLPARMRDYSFPSESTLQQDGANLSAVLWNLWGADSDAVSEDVTTRRREILEFIHSLPEQDIADLSFLREPRGGVMVKLTETFGGQQREFDASLLSDGTLRVLAVCAALLSASEGDLVVIEEIDNGVHPSRAKHLLSRILAVAERRHLRVLLSTHNPALLDSLPDAAVPDVVFCYRDPVDGTSRLVRLEDLPDYPELLAQGTLGRLVTAGVLERFVKARPSAYERRTNALGWLDQMRGQVVQ